MSVDDLILALRKRIPAQARCYVAGCSGEPFALADAFARAPNLARDLTFLGIWIPGVNLTDWASLHDTARAETIFLSAALRPSFERGHTQFMPLSYTQAWPWLETTPLHAAIAMVSPPDEDNRVSLGVSADFSTAVLNRPEVIKAAIINHAMPNCGNSATVPLDAFDLVGETDMPLVQVPPTPSKPGFTQLAGHVAGLIKDGDTLQFGLGNLQQSVLECLLDHRNLRVHSGMISDPILPLLDAGAIANTPGSVVTGVAIGTDTLYGRAPRDERIVFKPVAHTHAPQTLAAIDDFKAINSVIEVDLFGQANAEFVGGRQVSGTGGLVDFLRGARLARGGRAVTGLLSTAKAGTISRIVPRLPQNAVSIARADMDIVVTEHGVADLRDKTLDGRAEALIAIADPAFRNTLADHWTDMRGTL